MNKACRYCEDRHNAEDQWCSRECYELWWRSKRAKVGGTYGHHNNGEDGNVAARMKSAIKFFHQVAPVVVIFFWEVCR